MANVVVSFTGCITVTDSDAQDIVKQVSEMMESYVADESGGNARLRFDLTPDLTALDLSKKGD